MRKYWIVVSVLVIGRGGMAIAQSEYSDTTKAAYLLEAGRRCTLQSQFDSSAYYFDHAARLWNEAGRYDKVVESNLQQARNLVQLGKLDDGLSLLKRMEQMTIDHPESQTRNIGPLFNLMGFIYTAKEDYARAVRFITKSIDHDEKAFGSRSDNVAAEYYSLALAYKLTGKFDLALKYLLLARDIQTEIFGDEYYYLPNTLTMLGSVYNAKNEFLNAISCYDRALQILQKSNRAATIDAASCYLNMMIVNNHSGNYFKAIECGKKTIEIYNNLSIYDHTNIATVYGELGQAYTSTGDYEKSKEYLLRAISFFVTYLPEKNAGASALYANLGDVYRHTGDLDNALKYTLKSIQLMKQSASKDIPALGDYYQQLADIYMELKEYPEALKYYNEGLKCARKNSGSVSRPDLSSLYSSIANIYTQKHDYKTALEYLERAESIDQQSPQKDNPQAAKTFVRYGELYTKEKKYTAALRAYQSAILLLSESSVHTAPTNLPPECDNASYKKELVDVIVAKAHILEQLYSQKQSLADLKACLSHYQKAMDLVDDVRKMYSSDASKFHLVETSQSIYANACRISLILYRETGDAQYKERAFLVADRDKANIILEKLFDGEAKHFAGIPDSLLTYEKELLTNISFIETQIYKTGIKDEVGKSVKGSDNQKKLFNLKAEHQKLVDVFEKKYPQYYRLKYSRYELTLKDVQGKLGPSTAMIEYLIDASSTYVFLVTPKGLTVKTIKNSASIDESINRFVSTLKKYETQDFSSTGYSLYEKILLPLKQYYSSFSKLIIIPDGNLYYVPFEALPTSKSTVSGIPDFTSMPYLIKSAEITYSYSAQFYLAMLEQDKPRVSTGTSFVGFAPVFGDSAKNGNALLANRSYVEESGVSGVRSITLDGKTFNELRYSKDEVESISQSFNEHDLTAKSYLFTAATESNFKEYCGRYDIIHIATHGFINESNPKFSAILFSQPKSTSEKDDGILYIDETYNLNLKASLVVLSSCESGLGKLVHGEGMIALTRGLFYSGAKNIIFSLWKVSDKQTYHLMENFYKDMLNGKSYSASLREAKLAMIASKESAFPSKWSGFVLVGK